MSDNWIKLVTVSDTTAAEMLRIFLAENEIEVQLLNKKDSSYPVFGTVEVYCHVSQAYEAINLIEKYNQ